VFIQTSKANDDGIEEKKKKRKVSMRRMLERETNEEISRLVSL